MKCTKNEVFVHFADFGAKTVFSAEFACFLALSGEIGILREISSKPAKIGDSKILALTGLLFLGADNFTTSPTFPSCVYERSCALCAHIAYAHEDRGVEDVMRMLAKWWWRCLCGIFWLELNNDACEDN